MKESRFECHLVCGPPAAGKTRHARLLADRLGACLLDSDQVAERLVVAGLKLSGMNPDDRDSPAYKSAFRAEVYETLYELGREHLSRGPVVIAGPFTGEANSHDGLAGIEASLRQKVEAHFVWCAPDERRRRMERRGEARDLAKLVNWNDYLKTCREDPPPWPHRFVDTTQLQEGS